MHIHNELIPSLIGKHAKINIEALCFYMSYKTMSDPAQIRAHNVIVELEPIM